MIRGHGNTFDVKSFADAFGEAFDAQQFGDAFRSPFDLRDAGESVVAGFRHGARLLISFAAGIQHGARLLISQFRNLRVTAGTQVDNHSGTLARFEGILEEWNGRLVTTTLESLGRQLPYLLEDEEELAALSHPPDAASFGALLNYLGEHPWIKTPSLTLTRNGVFVGNWRPVADAKARLSIDFLEETRVRWSVVDARDAQAPTMIGGVCSIYDLDDYFLRYRDWLHL